MIAVDASLSLVNQTVGVFLIDLLLSGDNAILIAMACRGLPAPQRRQAMVFGIGAAFVIRVLLTAVASLLLDVPGLRLLGGLMLIVIAIQLLLPSDNPAPPSADPDSPAAAAGFARAIRTIVVADLVMSLDNVLALAAYTQGQFFMLVLGLLLSMPLLLLGSVMVSALLDESDLLAWAGAAFLGWIAGDLLINDGLFRATTDSPSPGLAFTVPLLCALYVVVQARLVRKSLAQGHLRRPETPFLKGLTGSSGEPAPVADRPAARDGGIEALRVEEGMLDRAASSVAAPVPAPLRPTVAVKRSPMLGARRILVPLVLVALCAGVAYVVLEGGVMPKPEGSMSFECAKPKATIQFAPGAGKFVIATAVGFSSGRVRDNKIDWDNYRASGKAIGFPPATDIVSSSADRLVVNGGMFVNAECFRSRP